MQRPPLIAGICALIGLILLGVLGTWQIQKYFIRAHDSALCERSNGHIYTQHFHRLHEDVANGCSITLSGIIKPSPLIPIIHWKKDGGGPSGHDPAYSIYTYLQADDGSRILANLGISDEKFPKISMQNVHMTGGFYKPAGPGAFSPPNNPKENIWYVLNPVEIQEHFNIKGNTSMYVFVAQDIHDTQNQKITRFAPAALHKSYLQPERHLQYALFWYAMACALSVIFFLRFCKKN